MCLSKCHSAIGVAFLFWGIIYSVWPKAYRGGITLLDDWLGVRRYFERLTDEQFTRIVIGPRLIVVGVLFGVLHVVLLGWK